MNSDEVAHAVRACVDSSPWFMTTYHLVFLPSH